MAPGPLRTFTPPALAEKDAIVSMRLLSLQYFRIANELRAKAREGSLNMPGHYYVFPAIIMFMATAEAFFQEHLAYSRLRAESPESSDGGAQLKTLDLLRMQRAPYQDFKEWIKEIFRLYDRAGVGIDTTCDAYANILALKELRNAVAHYNPSFIEHMQWPARLAEAFRRSRLEVINSGWVNNFSCIEVCDWAYRSVREIIELFAVMSGVENPFAPRPDELLKWEG